MTDPISPAPARQPAIRVGVPRPSRRVVALLAGAAAALALADGCVFVVQPTEMAGVRRLGRVAVDQPLGPGLHWKLPLVDTADRLQVSLETYRLDRLTVNTIDNQPVTIAVGLTYRIPPDAVLPLLYSIGRLGNLDIGENFQRIIADRAARVMAQQNTTRISENRERIAAEIRALLSDDLRRLYRIEVVDFQIAAISYSDSFRASVEAAVKAKNDAVAAENTVNRIRFEAQQAIERANGEAAAKLRLADAERQAAILAAQGKSEAIRLEGDARAAVLRAQAEVLNTSPLVVELAKADRWNGGLPQTVLGAGAGVPLISIGAPPAPQH